MGGIATAGVVLKSLGDYQRDQQLRDQHDAMQREQLRAATTRNDEFAKGVADSDRSRKWADEDRETAAAHMAALQPNVYQGDGPVPMPHDGKPTAATTMPDNGEAPKVMPVGLPPPNPAPPSAVPGATLQADTPAALPPPPKAKAAPQQPTGGRMGLYDVLAQKAAARGDLEGQQKYIAAKDQLEKEGFGKASRVALSDPLNVAGIEKAFNESGAARIVPGSLVANQVDGKATGTYNAIMIDPNGQQRPVQNYNIMNAAIALGVIAPPKTIHFKDGDAVYQQDASGKLTKIKDAGSKHKSAHTPQGDIYTTNEDTGTVTVTSASGDTTRLTPEQAKALPEINRLVTAEAKGRSEMNIPDPKRPPMEAAKVAGVAQSIFVNNPAMRKDGLSGPVAVEIATAIHDKNPEAKIGKASLNGELWNIVTYKGVTYGTSRVPQSQAPAPAAPAKAAAPAPAAAPKPAFKQYEQNGPNGTTVPQPKKALPAPPKAATAEKPPVFGGAKSAISPSTALAGDALKVEQDKYAAEQASQSDKKFIDQERYKFKPNRGYSKPGGTPPAATVERALALEKAKPGTFAADQMAYYKELAAYYKKHSQ